jgi:hypothetical protein
MRVAILALIISSCVLAVYSSHTRAEKEKKMNRIFEMRTYYAHPGKMKALHERFRNHTNKLFKKHGMELIGFWSPVDEKEADSKMVYILAYPSKESAAKSWKAFREDPDWIKAKSESEKDGVLVAKIESVYLNPTDYSPLK